MGVFILFKKTLAIVCVLFLIFSTGCAREIYINADSINRLVQTVEGNSVIKDCKVSFIEPDLDVDISLNEDIDKVSAEAILSDVQGCITIEAMDEIADKYAMTNKHILKVHILLRDKVGAACYAYELSYFKNFKIEGTESDIDGYKSWRNAR